MRKRTLVTHLFRSICLITMVLLFSIHCGANSESQKKFKAHNGVEIEYSVLLPANYQNSISYKTVIAFAGMDSDKDLAEWSEKNLWKNHNSYQSIVIIPKVPIGKAHWISHPIHHALNDFINYIHQTYEVKDQKVHFLGYKDGCIPAQTYITMLNRPPASLTLFSSQYWEHYNKSAFDALTKLNIPVRIYYSESDNMDLFEGKQILAELKKRDVNVSTDIENNPIIVLDRLFQ